MLKLAEPAILKTEDALALDRRVMSILLGMD
eukprot:SAG31_NODE_28207_length_414_cov_0.619048_1_plen_30_part_10